VDQLVEEQSVEIANELVLRCFCGASSDGYNHFGQKAFSRKPFGHTNDKYACGPNIWSAVQEALTEREGSVQLTSLYQLAYIICFL